MIKKFTSRKLLVAVVGIIIGIYLVLNGKSDDGIKVIMAAITIYIGAESYIDGKGIQNDNISFDYEDIVDIVNDVINNDVATNENESDGENEVE